MGQRIFNKKMKIQKTFEKKITAAVLLLLFSSFCFSQNKSDSISANHPEIKKDSLSKLRHSPKKATIMSLCLPGLGQAYNRKYWKIPIIYAGLGGLAYLTMHNNNKYQDFKNEYLCRTNTSPAWLIIILNILRNN